MGASRLSNLTINCEWKNTTKLAPSLADMGTASYPSALAFEKVRVRCFPEYRELTEFAVVPTIVHHRLNRIHLRRFRLQKRLMMYEDQARTFESIPRRLAGVRS
jgi:hypothetical protein